MTKEKVYTFDDKDYLVATKETNKAKLKQYLETDNKILKKERTNIKNRLSYIEAMIKNNDEKIKDYDM